ncbi:hypothetical protein [Ruminococcus albus]|uniref:hypothetical protein n=1 Tax=Ruminococcus albus TaxID=1264 RepID=UPI0004AE0522|nr:hypothetical protein [Ruminococcus albus]
MKHLFAGYDSFSALYRAEIFHGDLSKNETMLDKVSEYIKPHDSLIGLQQSPSGRI